MCQCLICDCWWCNVCGVCCAGVAYNYLCCSIWCCKAEDLQKIDANLCHCCTFEGLGGNFCCYGEICCAPDYLKQWSKLRSQPAGSPGAPK
jgi:hypothetical protein